MQDVGYVALAGVRQLVGPIDGPMSLPSRLALFFDRKQIERDTITPVQPNDVVGDDVELTAGYVTAVEAEVRL